jgi:choline dehydrogenase-like flavoprotein
MLIRARVCRGDKDDYDAWGALGNPGWSWNEMLPYFKKAC